MALNNVSFIIGANGLGAVAPGQDYISGMVFYSASYPSGFSGAAQNKQVFGINQAISLGITNTSIGETAAVSKVVVGGTPTVGDVYTVTYTGIDGVAVKLVDAYALVTADAVSVTTAGAKIAALINASTQTTGFSATAATGTVLITTKKAEGIFPNSGTPYAVSVSGVSTLTLTQPTGSGSTVLGVASVIDVMYYHVSEYFRMNPEGNLWIGVYPVPATFDGTEAQTLVNASNGTIRQVGVYYTNVAYAVGQTTALQTIATTLANNYQWTQFVYAGDISAVTDLGTLADLTAQTNKNVSVVIAQDGAAAGYKLYKATGKSISALGAVLGAVSSANVNDSIAYPAKFNFSNGLELDTLAFANGTVYTSLTTSALNSLNDENYIFLRKFTGYAGSFANSDTTAIVNTSDYAYISRNRVIQKAQRLLYSAYVPYLNFNNLILNADGTISENSASTLEAIGEQALNALLQAPTAISNSSVVIDRTQKPLVNNQLQISVSIQPKPNAANIVITIGYVQSI